MRALDFYSGVGGWSLGLRLGGVDVVGSYEWWLPALETGKINNDHVSNLCDVRSLNVDDLPQDIDLIVGSPPCTQFSFSNRGGKGDIEDGLRDVRKFLEIVQSVKPKYWVMENVPRLASIIRAETSIGGRLSEFSSLEYDVVVVDTEEYGLPQRRKRCFIGNLNFAILKSYRQRLQRLSLRDVVAALQKNVIVDPNYGLELHASLVTDNDPEEPLSREEIRLNEAAKRLHPIYNSMPFPDALDRASRTVTATCTRVSRESIVIECPRKNGLRRLTVRERATLQGFPITYQFHGANFSQKERLVGNAMPPPLAYYLSNVAKGVSVDELSMLSEVATTLTLPSRLATPTPTSKVGRSYSARRRFKFSIPNLHFKSGMRFELANHFDDNRVDWRVDFFFGSSKNIQKIALDYRLKAALSRYAEIDELEAPLSKLQEYLAKVDWSRLQDLWSHRGPAGTRPLDLLDSLARFAANLTTELAANDEFPPQAVREILENVGQGTSSVNCEKLFRFAPAVLAGMLVGCCTNMAANSTPYIELADYARVHKC